MVEEKEDVTQIQVKVSTATELKKLVGYGETYDDAITRLMKAAKKATK